MSNRDLEALAAALADARRLLERHGDTGISGRLRALEESALQGDPDAAITALIEATGGMGSFNDRILSQSNRDAIEPEDKPAVNAELQRRMRIVEECARAAAAAHGLKLWR